MTAVQTTFARVEKKYIVPERAYRALCDALDGHMVPDQFGAYTICNIYYDTPDYQLIRASLDKPVYKEKLRLRSYGVPGEGDQVFVELKKKFDGVVYKRRTAMPLAQARTWLATGVHPLTDDQICREIDWFLQFYRPQPAVFLAYDRVAYTCPELPDLRLTFDSRLRWREDALLRRPRHAADRAGRPHSGNQNPGRDAAVAEQPARPAAYLPGVVLQVRRLLPAANSAKPRHERSHFLCLIPF